MESEQSGVAEKNFTEKTPAELRNDFRETYGSSFKGSFPAPEEGQQVKDATKSVEAYETFFDTGDEKARHRVMQELPLRALAAGFEISSTFALPNIGESEGRTFTAVTYVLKSPDIKSQK